jgi:hypothetical protein
MISNSRLLICSRPVFCVQVSYIQLHFKAGEQIGISPTAARARISHAVGTVTAWELGPFVSKLIASAALRRKTVIYVLVDGKAVCEVAARFGIEGRNAGRYRGGLVGAVKLRRGPLCKGLVSDRMDADDSCVRLCRLHARLRACHRICVKTFLRHQVILFRAIREPISAALLAGAEFAANLRGHIGLRETLRLSSTRT